MEIFEIIKKIKNYKMILVVTAVIGITAGMFFYLMPEKYVSAGSIYVRREIINSTDFFTYEGYYAQQTAAGYTNSVTNLIESPDIQKMLLEKSGEEINTLKLINLQRKIKVKKTGPQIILLEIKEKTPKEAEDKWVNLANIVISESEEINREGDDNLSVVALSDKPLIRETYKNIYIFSLVGLLIGLTLGSVLVSFKEYFKK